MKNVIYEFIYLDKKGNVLKKELRKCSSNKRAKYLSKMLVCNTKLNDLDKIEIRLLPI